MTAIEEMIMIPLKNNRSFSKKCGLSNWDISRLRIIYRGMARAGKTAQEIESEIMQEYNAMRSRAAEKEINFQDSRKKRNFKNLDEAVIEAQKDFWKEEQRKDRLRQLKNAPRNKILVEKSQQQWGWLTPEEEEERKGGW